MESGARERELFGRADELRRLEEITDAASHGRGSAWTLVGAPGIGKTALLDKACSALPSARWRILRATGVMTEQHYPYAALHALLWPLRDQLDVLDPAPGEALAAIVSGSPTASVTPQAIGMATLALLAHAAVEQTVLLVLDDLQWFDGPSRECIAFVARRVSHEPIVLLGAVRAGEDDAVLGLPLPVGPLAAPAAAALLGAVTAQPVQHAIAAELARRTGGHALALELLARDLPADVLGGRAPLPTTLPIDTTISAHLAAGIAELSTPRRLALATLALAGERDDALARALAALDVPEDILDDPELDALIERAPGARRFRHPLIREAAAAQLDARNRHAIHRELAARTDDPVARAVHVEAAPGPDPADDSAALLAGAGAAQQRGDLVTGAWLVTRAADLATGADARADLLLLATTLRLAAGRPATDLFAALDTLDCSPERRVDRALLRMQAAAYVGDRDGLEAAEAKLAPDARAVGPDRASLRASLLMSRAWWDLDGPGIAAHSARLRAAAEAAADAGLPLSPPVRSFLVAAALFDGGGRAPVDLEPALEEARALPYGAPVVLTALMAVADTDRYQQVSSAAISAAREQGHFGASAAMYAVGAAEAAQAGRAMEAESLARQALAAREAGIGSGGAAELVFAESALARLAALRGLDDAARAHATRARNALTPDEGAVTRLFATATEALVAELAGRPAEALEGYLAVLRAAQRWPAGSTGVLRPHTGAIRCALAIGDAAAAAAALADLERLVATGPVAWIADLQLARARALIHGVAADAGSYFEAALAHHRGGEQLELALTHHLHAAWLSARRDPGAAAATERAGALAGWCDAPALLGRAASLRPATGAALTPQERLVALEVARGASNKVVASTLMLSTKTVEMHLTSVFRKLGVANRATLARLVAEAGPGAFGGG